MESGMIVDIKLYQNDTMSIFMTEVFKGDWQIINAERLHYRGMPVLQKAREQTLKSPQKQSKKCVCLKLVHRLEAMALEVSCVRWVFESPWFYARPASRSHISKL